MPFSQQASHCCWNAKRRLESIKTTTGASFVSRLGRGFLNFKIITKVRCLNHDAFVEESF